ncbi:MAG TPA: hypothetical protein VMW56_15040 [Candidatus Margulisiibacteriota bacterium]|nr:hypothetical protein [Candidatus Margulisiibacteriota bacterium]
MKVKRVKIGVRPPGRIFDEAAAVVDRLGRGKRVRAERDWIYFADVRAMGKVLTPKRLELLKAIRDHRPASVRALAALAKRDVKNVADDVGLLAALGLVDLAPSAAPRRQRAPRVGYATLTVEVHL